MGVIPTGLRTFTDTAISMLSPPKVRWCMLFFLVVSFQSATGIGDILTKRSLSKSNSLVAYSKAVSSLIASLLSENLKAVPSLQTISEKIALSTKIVGLTVNKETAQGLKMFSQIRCSNRVGRVSKA